MHCWASTLALCPDRHATPHTLLPQHLVHPCTASTCHVPPAGSLVTPWQAVCDCLSELLQADLHGVLPVHKASFAALQQNALRWSNRLKQAFAVCHSLHMVNKHTVAGVDVERMLFKNVEARFLVNSSSYYLHWICVWVCLILLVI